MANKTGKGGFRDNPQNRNTAGAPKRGESWGELIKQYGDMTPSEAAARAMVIAKEVKKIGDSVTLKEAVVLRVYATLLFDPQPGLLNAFMERAEGKVTEKLDVENKGTTKVVIEYAQIDSNASPATHGADPDQARTPEA